MENFNNQFQIILNLYKSREFYRAEKLCKKLILKYPRLPILYNVLGLIFTEEKKTDKAILYLEKGIKIDPTFAMFYNNLGNIYKQKENHAKAESCYKQSIYLDNKAPEPLNNLANLYRTLNQYDDSIKCYQKAIMIDPRLYISHYNLAVVYKSIGEFSKSKKHLEKVIMIEPLFCQAHRTLSQLTKYSKKDKHFNLLKKIYINPKINNSQKKELAFALGKASEDTNDFAQALIYFKKGNELRRKEFTYSIKHEKEEFLNIKRIFTKKFIDQFTQYGFLDFRPIFILGMPRSGTTLVEQILSSHPKVFAGDELNFLPEIIKKYFYGDKQKLINKNFLSIDKKIIESIGKEYIDYLKNVSTDAERVTDKLPINFKWIGLIKLILPNSKIIHCYRNSRDICLSIYKNYFTSNEMKYAYHLDEIIEFYNLYYDLMKHWNNVTPNFVYNIKYEEIIKNSKEQISKLLKNCNLSISDSCFKFYKNKRAIKTASDVQARKKIYSGSINSWKHYREELFNSFQKLSN